MINFRKFKNLIIQKKYNFFLEIFICIEEKVFILKKLFYILLYIN